MVVLVVPISVGCLLFGTFKYYRVNVSVARLESRNIRYYRLFGKIATSDFKVLSYADGGGGVLLAVSAMAEVHRRILSWLQLMSYEMHKATSCDLG
eukprot:5109216-Amphidinium_carterae.1